MDGHAVSHHWLSGLKIPLRPVAISGVQGSGPYIAGSPGYASRRLTLDFIMLKLWPSLRPVTYITSVSAKVALQYRDVLPSFPIRLRNESSVFLRLVRFSQTRKKNWLQRQDLNLRSSGYEPDDHFSTLHFHHKPCTYKYARKKFDNRKRLWFR